MITEGLPAATATTLFSVREREAGIFPALSTVIKLIV